MCERIHWYTRSHTATPAHRRWRSTDACRVTPLTGPGAPSILCAHGRSGQAAGEATDARSAGILAGRRLHGADAARPWPAVRMVDVAAAAGVSRQTLYNEFGSKEGLARALVRRETDRYLDGVDRRSWAPRADERRAAGRRSPSGPDAAARAHPLVGPLLTGCWSDRLPSPPRRPCRRGRDRAAPRRRPAAATRRFVTRRRDRCRDRRPPRRLTPGGRCTAPRCELAVRLALVLRGGPARTGPAGPALAELRAAHSGGRRARGRGQCAEPDSWRPMTPTITRVIETSLRVETTSPRKTMP